MNSSKNEMSGIIAASKLWDAIAEQMAWDAEEKIDRMVAFVEKKGLRDELSKHAVEAASNDSSTGWEDLLDQQGWDDDSQVLILESFVEEKKLTGKLDEYACEVASDESDGEADVGGWEDGCEAQGWDESTKIFLLTQFIENQNLWADFEKYASDWAADENGEAMADKDWDDVMEDSDDAAKICVLEEFLMERSLYVEFVHGMARIAAEEGRQGLDG